MLSAFHIFAERIGPTMVITLGVTARCWNKNNNNGGNNKNAAKGSSVSYEHSKQMYESIKTAIFLKSISKWKWTESR